MIGIFFFGIIFFIEKYPNFTISYSLNEIEKAKYLVVALRYIVAEADQSFKKIRSGLAVTAGPDFFL